MASDWLNEHGDLLRLGMDALTALVWVAYLQLFLTSLRRQRRSQILINRGVGAGVDARCFVGNLGHEPIYVLELIGELEADGRRLDAVITDRSDLSRAEVNDPREAANQGPLKSGESYDAGSFRDIADRVLRAHDAPPGGAFDRVALTVVAATAASGEPVAARRSYRRTGEGDAAALRPDSVQPRQIRSRLQRRRLKRRLRRDLAVDAA